MDGMEIVTKILPFAQITLSILLIVAILLQQSGAGLGGALGGSDSVTTYHTKRGFEKFLFYFSMVLAVLFFVRALLAVLF